MPLACPQALLHSLITPLGTGAILSVLRSLPLRCSIRADMYYSHEYAGLEDMDAMLGLVSASWRRDGLHNRFHIGDVYRFLGTQREETPDLTCSSIRL